MVAGLAGLGGAQQAAVASVRRMTATSLPALRYGASASPPASRNLSPYSLTRQSGASLQQSQFVCPSKA